MLKAPAAQATLLCRSGDLNVLRGVLMGYYAYCTVPVCTFHFLRIKLEKWGFDRCTFPYHASRDCLVRWEHFSHIKCPGFYTHDRLRGNAFALEAHRFTRCPFSNRQSLTIEPWIIRSTVFLYLRLGSISRCGSSYGFGVPVFVLDCRV
jgi:hypothetical protein